MEYEFQGGVRSHLPLYVVVNYYHKASIDSLEIGINRGFLLPTWLTS